MSHDFTFAGTLTARDCKRHIEHRFQLPSPAAQLTIQLDFAPHRVGNTTNLVTLTLFDPNGFRGAGHRGGHQHVVRIDATAATPGYIAGPLPAGEWIVQLDTHMIMPGEPLSYTVTVAAVEAAGTLPQTPTPPAKKHPSPPRGPGWYRGELHSHTDHSDGSRTVAELVATARQYKLDFIFLTDHNTVSGLAEVHQLGSDDLLTLGGLELTTFWGHALCLGTDEWIDWRVRPGTGAMPKIAETVAANDQLFIIAHPMAIGDPLCTGCIWRYPELLPGVARFVEIWNGPWPDDSNNQLALNLWYDWLNQGLRVVATAGTDTHSSTDYARQPGFNVIYAETLSQAALFAGLRRGQLYLSAGPTLSFSASDDTGAVAEIGATVSRPATFRFAWHNCPADAEVRVIVQGRLYRAWPCHGEGTAEWQLAPVDGDWCTVEIRSHTDDLLAITNPIFLQTL